MTNRDFRHTADELVASLRTQPADRVAEVIRRDVTQGARMGGLSSGERGELLDIFLDYQPGHPEARLDDLPIENAQRVALQLLCRAPELWTRADNHSADKLHRMATSVNTAALLLATAARAELAPGSDPWDPEWRESRRTEAFAVLQTSAELGVLLAAGLNLNVYPAVETQAAAREAGNGFVALASALANRAGLEGLETAATVLLWDAAGHYASHDSGLQRRVEAEIPDRTLTSQEQLALVTVLLGAVREHPSKDPLLANLRNEGRLDGRIRELTLLALLVNSRFEAVRPHGFWGRID